MFRQMSPKGVGLRSPALVRLELLPFGLYLKNDIKRKYAVVLLLTIVSINLLLCIIKTTSPCSMLQVWVFASWSSPA